MDVNDKPRPLYTIPGFSQKYPAFSQPALRALIDKARPRVSSRGPIPGNGLSRAMVRVGRRILLDEEAFFQWLAQQNDEPE